MPRIIEPESNLMSDSLVMERQKAEALVLDDDVKIIAEDPQDWRNLTTYTVVGLLSVVSLVFFVAFLIVKRKYEQVRNELYYSTSNYSASNTYSEAPSYNSASHMSSGATIVPSEENLGKNFSFATATRNILLGKDLNSLQNDGRNKMLFHPRVESHLIESQKQAVQNVYADVVLNMQEDAAKRLKRSSSPPTYSSASEAHIYQVPRPVSNLLDARGNLPDLSTKSFPPSSNNTTSNSLDETLEDDSTSNIYEEIHPRK